MSTDYNILRDKEIFEYLGRAIYESQRLEVSLAYIIRDLHLLTGQIQGNDLLEQLREFQMVLDSRLKQTLGKLFRELQKIDKLDNESERLLSEALEKRNEIVHRFFYKHWVVAIAPAARDTMICELKDAIETMSNAFELSKMIQQKIEAKLKSNAGNSNTTV